MDPTPSINANARGVVDWIAAARLGAGSTAWAVVPPAPCSPEPAPAGQRAP